MHFLPVIIANYFWFNLQTIQLDLVGGISFRISLNHKLRRDNFMKFLSFIDYLDATGKIDYRENLIPVFEPKKEKEPAAPWRSLSISILGRIFLNAL